MTRWTLDFEALAAGMWPLWGSPCGALPVDANRVRVGGIGALAGRSY
jgi:hypothetical protein